MMLAADAQADSERQMIASGQPLRADVLKVGHHRSSASTTEPFVSRVAPKLAVISVNAGNANGYPNRPDAQSAIRRRRTSVTHGCARLQSEPTATACATKPVVLGGCTGLRA